MTFGTERNSYIAGTIASLQHSGKNGTDSLKIYLWNNTNHTATPAYAYALPFAIQTGYTYQLTMRKLVWDFEVMVLRSDGLAYTMPLLRQNSKPNFGCLWGYPTAFIYAGHVQVTKFSITSSYSTTPTLLAFMDSYGEGNALSGLPGQEANAYINMLGSIIGFDQVVVCARGGESTVSAQTRFSGELDWYHRARFGLIALGINDNDTTILKKNLAKMTDSLLAYQITPIVATIPPRADAANNRAWVLSINHYIRTVIAGKGARIFDIAAALTVNGKGLYFKPGYYMRDSVHISPLGNQAALNQLGQDVPKLIPTSLGANLH